MTTRKVEVMDGAPIMGALLRLQEFAKAYSWVGSVDWESGTKAIHAACSQGQGYIVDGYLVMTDVVTPWYTQDKVLQEWLVIKVYQGGHISSVPPALEALAINLGCKFVMSADSSPVNIVGKAYSDAGFQPLTHSYYKAINGIR